ncbi:ionotropic receptor 21a [Ischnura elegans]|uniref:ionotropic receptor 21a n=1 Tax=Ischnura elegans TaxID=197161 RepID=UPI001ED8BB06|nr:ionotropic receptor 21a [Ischnura elegans]
MFPRADLLLPGAITLCLARTVALGVDKHLKIIAMEQPPFTLTRLDGRWVGIEVRFLEILSKSLNFTFDVTTAGKTLAAPTATWTSSDAAVVVELAAGVADLGIGGVHLTPETEFKDADVRSVFPHSQDCGAFITQASVALPRHRAIMGPFHWKVWLALTVAYLFGSIPLAILSSTSRYFSSMQPRSVVPSAVDRAEADEGCLCRVGRTLRSTCRTIKWLVRKIVFVILRLHDAFWDIFGTFTNAFTLSKGWRSIGLQVEELKKEEERSSTGVWRSRRGSQWIRRTPESARRGSKVSWVSSLEDMFMSVIVGTEGLRLLVAFYWAFTVIVSALYTGSIIAFITLPVFPKPYDTGEELLHAGYTWGTIGEHLFTVYAVR